MRYRDLLAEARNLGGFAVKPLTIQSQGTEEPTDEAVKLDAPQRRIPRDELQGYADRIKTGTKTKKDKFAPIIHGSNINHRLTNNNNNWWI
jgi:hypothetical protein